jgi:hypothetical protein
MKNDVFWDVGPCRSCANRRFGGTYCLHLQGRKIRERGTSLSRSAATYSHWFLARGLFYPEDGGNTFLRNVGSHKIYTAPHPRRRHSLFYGYVCFCIRLTYFERSRSQRPRHRTVFARSKAGIVGSNST